MKHFESSESIQIKSKNDCPSPEIPHESRTNSRVLARVCDVEGGAICSKNSTFVSRTFEDGRVNKRIFQESSVKERDN